MGDFDGHLAKVIESYTRLIAQNDLALEYLRSSQLHPSAGDNRALQDYVARLEAENARLSNGIDLLRSANARPNDMTASHRRSMRQSSGR